MNTSGYLISEDLVEEFLKSIPDEALRAKLTASLDTERKFLAPVTEDLSAVFIDGIGIIPLDYASLDGPPIVPVSRGLMPESLSAENGAKAALTGEFYEMISCPCPNCVSEECLDSSCEICHGDGEYERRVDIPWTTIKDIYARAFELLAQRPQLAQSIDSFNGFEQWYRRQFRLPAEQKIDWSSDDVQKRLDGWLASSRINGIAQ